MGHALMTGYKKVPCHYAYKRVTIPPELKKIITIFLTEQRRYRRPDLYEFTAYFYGFRA